MRVAFDEHIPSAMARAFALFAAEGQFKRLVGGVSIEKARDYAPQHDDDDFVKGSDVPWIRRFAKSGGRFIISGDINMMREPHERLALIEEGMVVFFFGNQWSQWNFFRKCALLLIWFPIIVEKMKRGRGKGKFWRIPTSWNEGGTLQSVSTKDRKLIRIERQKTAQPRIAAARRRRKQADVPNQGKLRFPDTST